MFIPQKKTRSESYLFVVYRTMVSLTTKQVKAFFGELEYIELQLNSLDIPGVDALLTDFPNTLLPKGRDCLSSSCVE